jgi:tRNA 2-thiocytidine biosynthesis protein TtcA
LSKGLKKKINHEIGKALNDWEMIQKKDRILVALSGGLDSQALLDRLFAFQKRAPVDFELFPVHIDAGFEGSSSTALTHFVGQAYGPLRIEHTDFGVTAHSKENTENPCFLCARLRRKRLFEIARELDCKKIAFGHNKDDIIETLFINIFYAGKIGTMKPKQSFFDQTLDIIRPLSYVEKKEITMFCHAFELPEFKNNCPSADKTMRGEIRQMLESMYVRNRHIKGNIFRAMGNIATDYLLD